MTDAGSARNALAPPVPLLSAIAIVLGCLWFAQPEQPLEFPADSTLAVERVPRYFEPEYEGWKQFSTSLFDLQRIAAEESIQLGFALIPSSIGYGRYPFRKEHELIRGFLDDRGIPSVDLLDTLSEVVASEHRVHPSHGYPDALVHQKVAAELLERAPWDQWLQECPAGSSAVIKNGADSTLERLCVSEGGLTEGPYQREEAGRRVASGSFSAGRRTGPWLEAGKMGSPSADDTAQVILARGSYVADKREGPWREFWLRPGPSQESDISGGARYGLSGLLLPDLWSYLGNGIYRKGARSGRWTWVRAADQGEEELLAMRCYQAGELVWAWKSRPRGEEGQQPIDESLGEGHGGGAQGVENHLQMGPDGANPGPEAGQCPEGQDCSGIVPEGLPAQERNCNNQLDDDADNFIDCHDRDCSNDAACRHLLPSVGNRPADDDDSSQPNNNPTVVDGEFSSGRNEDGSQDPAALDDGAIPLGDDDDSARGFSHETIHYRERGPDTPPDVSSMTASRVWTFQCP